MNVSLSSSNKNIPMSRFVSTLKTFPKTFWAANTLELFERWAYYGLFNLLALYLTNSKETGALGFTQVEKGMIMGIVNAILYFLPIITGAIADKFGFKKVLISAFVTLSTGYFWMGSVTSYPAVFLTFFYVAIGAALFKPIISATIAKTTNESNSSIGFGIFYMIVNIGGLIGPFTASYLREMNWHYMFLMSSSAILLNLIIVIFFYKEPQRIINQDSLFKSLKQVFLNIFSVLKDFRFVGFLLIIAGAWTVYWQYFYSLPVFMEQWVDTSSLYKAIYSFWPGLANAVGTSDGHILTEKIIAMDAFFIVAFQVIISTIVMRIRPLGSMTIGILINSLGLALMVMTRNPIFALSSIFIFSIGEMTFSPKILEYVSQIAPKDKTGLYMGVQFLPIALGNFLGGFISGEVYLKLSDKFEMVKKLLPQINSEHLSNDQLFDTAAKTLNTTNAGLTQTLWDTYHPEKFALVLLGIGVITVVLLYFYNIVNKRQNNTKKA